MKAREIMTSDPKCCSANDSAKQVAQMMRDHDCGAVPVVDENSRSVIGIVTDRDLATRGLANGKGADTKASGVCVGIVSQADIARAALRGDRLSEREVAVVVERISGPRP